MRFIKRFVSRLFQHELDRQDWFDNEVKFAWENEDYDRLTYLLSK
jgi:hypothetical protein